MSMLTRTHRYTMLAVSIQHTAVIIGCVSAKLSKVASIVVYTVSIFLDRKQLKKL